MKKFYLFLRLLGLIRPFWRGMLFSVLLSLATILSGISLMATSAWLIATAGLQLGIASLGVAPPMVRFFGIARAILRYFERIVSHNLTFRLLAKLRVWFYKAIEPLAPARIAHYRSGDLLGRVVADVETLENIFLRVIAPPIVALLIGTLVTIVMLGIDPLLGVVFFLGYILAGTALPLLAWRTGAHEGAEYVQKRGEMNAMLIDHVQGLADLIAYGNETQQVQKLRTLNDDLAKIERRMALWDGLQTGISVLLIHLTAWAVLWVAIPRIDGVFLGTLALATIASFEAIQPLIPAVHHLGENLASAERLFEIVDAPAPINTATSTLSLDTTRPIDLHLKNVTFRYDSSAPPVLDNVTLSVPHGKIVAIVGASGAGKSTIANLLLRFWDAQAGHIYLNDVDIKTLAPEDVRHVFGLMTQRTHLFNTTIRENISIARENITEGDVHRATDHAQLTAFISQLPQGALTQVGEGGMAISGGERQRVALARMWLKDAPIWILDEPTANLDSITERAILQTLFNERGDKTILLITHRMTYLDRIDAIFVLNDGRIVEHGTHAELLSNPNGVYARLWQLQTERLTI